MLKSKDIITNFYIYLFLTNFTQNILLSKHTDKLSILSSNISMLDKQNNKLANKPKKKLTLEEQLKNAKLKPVSDKISEQDLQAKLDNKINQQLSNNNYFSFLTDLSSEDKDEINNNIESEVNKLYNKIESNIELKDFTSNSDSIEKNFEIAKNFNDKINSKLTDNQEKKIGDNLTKIKQDSNIDLVDDISNKFSNLDANINDNLKKLLNDIYKLDQIKVTDVVNLNSINILKEKSNLFYSIQEQLNTLLNLLEVNVNADINEFIKFILQYTKNDMLAQRNAHFQMISLINLLNKINEKLHNTYKEILGKYKKFEQAPKIKELKDQELYSSIIDVIKEYIKSDYSVKNEYKYTAKIKQLTNKALGINQTTQNLIISILDSIELLRKDKIKELYKLAYLYKNNEHVKLVTELEEKYKKDKHDSTSLKAKEEFKKEKISQKIIGDLIKKLYDDIKKDINNFKSDTTLNKNIKDNLNQDIDNKYNTIINSYDPRRRELDFDNIFVSSTASPFDALKNKFDKMHKYNNSQSDDDMSSSWD